MLSLLGERALSRRQGYTVLVHGMPASDIQYASSESGQQLRNHRRIRRRNGAAGAKSRR